jgi:hypothetical protein
LERWIEINRCAQATVLRVNAQISKMAKGLGNGPVFKILHAYLSAPPDILRSIPRPLRALLADTAEIPHGPDQRIVHAATRCGTALSTRPAKLFRRPLYKAVTDTSAARIGGWSYSCLSSMGWAKIREKIIHKKIIPEHIFITNVTG